MILPELHIKESLRLEVLDKYDVLDTPYEDSYDSITELASEISKMPIALISLIDEKRQWFKSHHGLAIRETPREYAFCAHAINCKKDIFVVNDCRTDPRFKNNPFVIGEPKVVFYAGVPLIGSDKLPLGTLCIIDNKPRQINAQGIQALKLLAKQVMILFESKRVTNELKQSIVHLSRKNKDLDKFAFTIAHDLKSPLNNIAAISELLSKQYDNELDTEGHALIMLINKSSKKLKVLINDILNYYTNENKMHEEVSVIRISEFYNQLFEQFNYEPSLHLKLETSIKDIVTNSTMLYQIMVNLISNTLRYSDKKNITSTIRVFEKSSFYEFHVEDNGPGIPEHLHNAVFDLFKVGKKVDKDGKKGKGIGLATVKRLVENLGGTIKVVNGTRSGCAFIFQIKKLQI